MRVLRGVVSMTKRSGPRTEPWGTPQEEVCQEDRSVSHFTRKQRSVHIHDTLYTAFINFYAQGLENGFCVRADDCELDRKKTTYCLENFKIKLNFLSQKQGFKSAMLFSQTRSVDPLHFPSLGPRCPLHYCTDFSVAVSSLHWTSAAHVQALITQHVQSRTKYNVHTNH